MTPIAESRTGRCCSFSTISSICLFNSTIFGSRSSRGLPIQQKSLFESMEIIFYYHIRIYLNFLFLFLLVDYHLLTMKVFVNVVIIVILVDFLYTQKIKINLFSMINLPADTVVSSYELLLVADVKRFSFRIE